MKPLRLVFMGTPAFAVPALQALIDSPHEVVGVYTQPPRPAGRGQKERPSPVQQLAQAHHLPVFTPATLKTPEAQLRFANLKADAAIVAAYGLILPQAILDATPLGCINIHPSLLPRWRGAAPIQRSVMAGDSETGICIMQMDAGLDTGGILLTEHVIIAPNETAGELHDRLATASAPLLLKALEGLAAGRITATPQPSEGVVYAHKISKEEARIDWSAPAAQIHHYIRGLSPFPAATCHIHSETVKVLRSQLVTPPMRTTPPGTVLDDALTIACGEGALRLITVQRPGKKAMSAEEMLRGFAVVRGMVLE